MAQRINCIPRRPQIHLLVLAPPSHDGIAGVQSVDSNLFVIMTLVYSRMQRANVATTRQARPETMIGYALDSGLSNEGVTPGGGGAAPETALAAGVGEGILRGT